MHIKQITLHNFRSYRAQEELPNGFHRGTNTIVGRNGSGKSNWLQAVQFCLGLGPYALLRQEDRQGILHEGSGQAAVHAFVEVVLDNSQQRMAVAAADVTIRRTIGWKKDEFFLQRQRCTKQEITSLLEGAGFSKQNPYYIVQQGKVNALCTMTDLERLRLLQQVAGTTLYDEKKRDSVAHMNDNQGRLDQVHALLQEMQDKLSELESEKEELQQYQTFDRQRRALSYALYEKELHKARRQLNQIEEERQQQLTEVHQRIHQDAKAVNDEILKHEDSILPLTNAAYQRWSQQAKQARRQHGNAKTNLQIRQDKLRHAQEQLQKQQEEREANQSQANQLQERLQETESDLEKVRPLVKEAQEAMTALEQERKRLEGVIQGLYAKQGRATTYKTVEERDAALQSQIQALQQQIASVEEGISGRRQSLEDVAKKQEQEKDKTTKLEAQLAKNAKNMTDVSKKLSAEKDKKPKLMADQQSAYGQLELKNSECAQAQKDWRVAQEMRQQSMPRNTAHGLDALPGVVNELGLTNDQYFGTVMENFTLTEDKYQTCVEMAAQNALFHVIVDNDETASKLVQRLEKDRAGRVTFLPLQQLRPEPLDERATSDDARPLMSMCLRFDPAVEKAMQQVFGSKWLARNADIANEVCQKFHVDVLTLEGDLCSRKGAMTGGYMDTNKSRLAAHKRCTLAQANLQKARDEKREAEAAVSNAVQELQSMEHSVSRLGNQLQQMQIQKNQYQKAVEASRSAQEKLERHNSQLAGSTKQDSGALAENKAELARLQKEIGTPLQTNLSEDDEKTLAESKDRLEEIVQEELPKAKAEAGGLGSKEQKFHLAKKQIAEKIQQLSGPAKPGMEEDDDDDEEENHVDEDTIVELEDAEKQAEELLAASEKDLNTAAKSLADAKKKYVDAKQELERLKQQDENLSRALGESEDKLSRLVSKRQMVSRNREEYTNKIQQLGSLPPHSELEKYANNTISDLMKKLDKVNKKLKDLSHVNKKACDLYVNFSEQREALLKRKEELDQGSKKVRELIDSLDRQKDEAINRTFRGVSAHFRDVFKELVPNGAGELIMHTDVDNEEEADTDDEEGSASSPKKSDPNNPSVSMYRGIGIKVRFSEVGENYMMSQLSGGQKALVALCLVFSIQRCDPAPFYMFDELDQALDGTYRAAVANLIQRQAHDEENPTQFIVTTFRPELVKIADRVFGVSLQNKVSTVHPLTRNDALRFVASLQDEEKLDDATSAAPSRATRRSSSTGSRKRKSTAEEDEAETVQEEESTVAAS